MEKQHVLGKKYWSTRNVIILREIYRLIVDLHIVDLLYPIRNKTIMYTKIS